MKNTTIFSFILILCSLFGKAQCPSISGPTVTNISCTTTPNNLITLTANYSANITSSWVGPSGEPIASVGSATTTANIANPGTYVVKFIDNSSSCIVNHTLVAYANIGVPTFVVSSPSSFSQTCSNSLGSIQITSVITSPVPNVPVHFAICPTSVTPIYTVNPNLQNIGCGNYHFFVKDLTNNCVSSTSISIACSTITPSPISIAGSAATLCLGSSVTYTASGANTYTWSNGPVTQTMNAIPSSFTTYVVNATDANGCSCSNSISINPNPNCAIVWPGDANSDGVVNNLDPFEIGLAMSLTGPARQSITNAFNSWYATAWAGTVSTGKNLSHADCNGDGIINTTDNGAITLNFNLTHAFKQNFTEVTNADLTIVPTQSVGYINEWNIAEIFLGSSTSTLNQLYGVAYEINFDSSYVENGSTINFNQSFLNNLNQNITFNKLIYADQKHYITNVRIDAQNVGGNGKIGEIVYKVKAGTPENSLLNMNLLNVIMIDNTGLRTNLSGGSSTLNLITNPNGINELSILENSFSIYPNPTQNKIIISSLLSGKINYSVLNILGMELLKDSFDGSTNINLSELHNGTYIVKLSTGNSIVYKRVALSK